MSDATRLLARWYPLAIFVTAVVHVLGHAVPGLFGDEWRYLWYAGNLLHGYYTPRDNEMIWNGPGYPLMLVPFVSMGTALIVPKLVNAVLLTLAVLHVHRTLLFFCSPARATVGGLLLGLSPLSYQSLHLLYTESLAVFLLSGALYHFCASRRGGEQRQAVLAGLYLGALTLTKVSFGPLLLLGLIVAGGLHALGRRPRVVKRSLVMLGVAFGLCVPWLSYTYSLSGKWFYWASGGGLLFYWMTTPYAEELGDGFHHRNVDTVPFLHEHHGKIFAALRGDPKDVAGTDLERWMPGVGRLCSIHSDLTLWKLGLAQLEAHPLAYARKWVFNVGRLFFNYPYTLKVDVDARLIALHVLLLGALLVVAARRIRGKLHLPPQLDAVAGFALVATGLSTVLGAGVRYLYPLYPAYLLLALAGTAPERKR